MVLKTDHRDFPLEHWGRSYSLLINVKHCQVLPELLALLGMETCACNLSIPGRDGGRAVSVRLAWAYSEF